jgi:hypothetical protein
VPAREIDVSELVALADDDQRWNLPAVAFLRDGSIVPLGRSFRQAHDEVTQAEDSDVYLHDPRIMAEDLRNLGVLISD